MNFVQNMISERELEVLEKISLGMTVKEIANTMFLSPHTIISHRRNLLIKLHAKNGAAMVRAAIEIGLLQIPTSLRAERTLAS